MNSCSQGALAVPVRNALDEYLDGMYEKGSLWDQWIMHLEELRDLVASTFGTKRTNVAITTTASAGVNSVLSAFDFSGKKKRIVTTDLEFPTIGQILHAQEIHGAEVVHVKSNQEGLLDLEEFESALDERVALVAVTHVCYRHGAMTDIKKVTELAHKQNIPVLVDAYQSAGSVPINFDSIGADFMVGGFLKYMLGIPGIGFLLVKEGNELIPTKTGWFAARDIFSMNINSYEPAHDARRFEEGTPPIPSVFAAKAGLALLREVDLHQSWKHNLVLFEYLYDEVSRQGIKIATPRQPGSHGSMLTLVTNEESKIVSALESKGIITSSRSSNLRISPHFYNVIEDIDNLLRHLRTYRHLLVKE